MSDLVIGTVARVVDGDTFDINVAAIDRGDTSQYSSIERIRLREIDAPEIGTRSGGMARAELERLVLGEEVRCTVHSRDAYGRLVCSVSLSGGEEE